MNAALNDNPEATAEERIAQVLLAKGRLKEADHSRALRLQTESGGSLSGLLVRLGMVSERDMAEASSEVFHLPLLYSKDCSWISNLEEKERAAFLHSENSKLLARKYLSKMPN